MRSDRGGAIDPALFALASAPRCETRRVGRSDEPVIVIDGGFADPQAIAEAVVRHGRFSPIPIERGGYPGVQAPSPRAYAEALLAVSRPALAALFGAPCRAIDDIACQFSLVAVPSKQLHPLQTVPHVDVADPWRFAVLHFLCGPPFGGTAFYRQDATGLEQVARADLPALIAARDDALGRTVSPGYPSEDTPGYTRIAAVEAHFDRVLVYRSLTLHSGIIPPDVAHPADPRHGRLTGNLFGRYEPG